MTTDIIRHIQLVVLSGASVGLLACGATRSVETPVIRSSSPEGTCLQSGGISTGRHPLLSGI